MRVPGTASLQWEIVEEEGASRLVQTALFVPRGLWGVLYWYSLYPLHRRIFSDLAKAIASEAEAKWKASDEYREAPWSTAANTNLSS
jgi:hypothetical protein